MHSVIITKPSKKVFAVLDIGTTKVACIIVKITTNNTIQVLGVGYKKSAGVYSGAIINVKEAFKSVASAIEEAEKNSEETIEEVYINVSGTKISSKISSTTIADINGKVTNRDIKRIFNQSNENINNSEAIIHSISLEYILDNIKGITDPVGMYGSIVQANTHIITIPNSLSLNLQHCVTQNQVYFKGCIVSAYSSGVSCINEDEKELGITVIDIGGGSTSVGVFKGGNLIYAASIPVGGVLITRDIASAFSIEMKDAEKLKVLRGNVILTTTDNNEIMEVERIGESNEKVQISLSDLVSVIRPRVEEIFEMIRNDLQDKITSRVVITGGTSELTSVREVSSHILGCQTRLGVPVILDGMKHYNRNPSLSAIIGSTILISQLSQGNNSEKTGFFNKIFEFVKGS